MSVETDLSGHTILVVDDNAANLGAIANHLEAFDLRVLTAMDGQDALETVQAARPDLILLDVMMPGLDGFEVCRRLKAEEMSQDIPIIFMTILAETEHKVRGFEVGGVDYVVKPVQHQELLARVRTHLALRAAHRQLDARNAQLEHEIAERQSELLARRQAESQREAALEALQQAHDELERRVEERTAELSQANASLMQTTQALRESEAKIRAVLNAIPDLVFILSQEGVFLEYTQAKVEDLYLLPEAFLGKPASDVLPPWLAQLTLEHIERALQSGQTQMYVYRLLIDGEARNFEARLAVSSEGQIVCIVRDITKRVQAEEEIRQQRTQLRALSARLAEAEEAERRRLARELHDRVGQNLSTMGFILNIIRDQVGQLVPETESDVSKTRAFLTHLDDALEIVRQTTDDVRTVMAELRPPVLDDYGLAAALRWYGEQFSQRTDLRLTVQGDDVRLPASVENALFRITQEALTNVARHAQASQVSISLTAADEISLVIADNGVGFDLAQVPIPAQKGRWGLLNMAERAASVDGECRVESAPGQGTTVTVRIQSPIRDQGLEL